MLTGRIIDAAEADRIGLVLRVVPDDRLLEEAVDVAGQIAANSPGGAHDERSHVVPTGGGLTPGRHRSGEPDPGSGHHDRDMVEAVTAFLEKRPPKFG